MSPELVDERKDLLRVELAYRLLKRYGDRLTINRIDDLKNRKYRVSLNYNKIFHIVDNHNKKVYVRNIFFENLYVSELAGSDEIDIPIPALNKAINNEFADLRESLFKQVLSNKELMIRIIRDVHTPASFMGKFYTILNELAVTDVVTKKDLDDHQKVDAKYQQYVDLVVSSNLAELCTDGRLKASNSFKKLMEQHSKNRSGAVQEAIAIILTKNYDYIIHELGLRHVKAYVDIVSSMFYLTKRNRLENIPIDIRHLYQLHTQLFDGVEFATFKDRVNALVMSEVFTRQDSAVQLAAV